MAFPPRKNAPTYARQNSVEPPPLLRYDAPYPPSSSSRQPPRSSAPTPPSKTPARNNTVRGAVRGTVRQQGSIPLPQQPFVPTRALTRGKTLTRPDRFVAPAPLINPNAAGKNGGKTKLVNGVPTLIARKPWWDPWKFWVYGSTCWAPAWILRSCSGLETRQKQRAWKEKVALCTIAVLMGGLIAFLTIGLTRVLCPVTSTRGPSAFTRLGTTPGRSSRTVSARWELTWVTQDSLESKDGIST